MGNCISEKFYDLSNNKDLNPSSLLQTACAQPFQNTQSQNAIIPSDLIQRANNFFLNFTILN